MIADLKPYPAMKDSGVDWLGEVPEHWEVERLKNTVDGCFNGIWGSEPDGREDLPCVRVADFDRWRLRVRLAKPTLRTITTGERNRRMLKRGDLLLEKSGGGDLQPVGVVILYDHDVEAVCSNFVARMPAVASCDSSYLTYLHSHLYAIRLNVRSIKQTTGIQNLDSSSYLSEPVALPPLSEQNTIVQFIDYVDRRIRRYIQAKQKLIKLLEEQKQASIHRAVTRGLDPDVPLKPSGVDWLGDVPEHWEVIHLRRYWDVVDCKHLTVPFVEDGIPLASVREVLSFDLDLSTAKHTTEEWYSHLVAGGRSLQCGDLIYCRNVSVGACTHVSTSDRFAMGQDVCRIRSKQQSQRYLNYYLHSLAMKDQLASLLIGSTFNRINVSKIKNLIVPVPPLDEQQEIVKFLDPLVRELAEPAALVRREIDLIREYRTRLIADVVTGKLDVREAAASLPEELNDLEEEDEFDETLTNKSQVEINEKVAEADDDA
jgi:type I restriction enzyme S subunit